MDEDIGEMKPKNHVEPKHAFSIYKYTYSFGTSYQMMDVVLNLDLRTPKI